MLCKLMTRADKAGVKRATDAVLKMVKPDAAGMQAAFDGDAG